MIQYLLIAVTFLSVIFTQNDCNIPGTVLDDCNICVGGDSCFAPIISPSQFKDCAGVCFGDAYLDNCGICDDDPSNDCNSLLGDLNNDAIIDVFDVVQLVGFVLDGTYHPLGNLNGDGSLNVTDVVMMVNIVLFPPMTYPSGTLTIQEAIDIAAQDGRDLVFVNPLSNYYVDATIKIPSNIEIDFNGARITRDSNSNPLFFNIIENLDTTSCSGCGNSNIVIKNLTVDGNAGYGIFGEGGNSPPSPHVEQNRFSGIHFSNVSESTLINVAATRTINGEIRFGNDESPPNLNDVRSASGIFFTGCNDIYANELHAYDNDYTGIFIHNSTDITIDGSITCNNGGSGISSRNADNCNFYNIESHDNGFTEYPSTNPPHFSNVSINGDCCIIDNVATYNSSGSGLNIGHACSEESRSNYAIANDVNSFNNILEGVTIKGADCVQLTNSQIHNNLRNNILIKDEECSSIPGTIWTTNYARITDSDIYGYYDIPIFPIQNIACSSFFLQQYCEDQYFCEYNNAQCEIDNLGGYGIRIQGSYGHYINRNVNIYDNFTQGIGIINSQDTSEPAAYIGPEVTIYDNGRADELSDLDGGIPSHTSAGIYINYSYNVTVDCPTIYCNEILGGGKSQNYGILVDDQTSPPNAVYIGGGHQLSGAFNNPSSFADSIDIKVNGSPGTKIDGWPSGWADWTIQYAVDNNQLPLVCPAISP